MSHVQCSTISCDELHACTISFDIVSCVNKRKNAASRLSATSHYIVRCSTMSHYVANHHTISCNNSHVIARGYFFLYCRIKLLISVFHMSFCLGTWKFMSIYFLCLLNFGYHFFICFFYMKSQIFSENFRLSYVFCWRRKTCCPMFLKIFKKVFKKPRFSISETYEKSGEA